MLLSEEINPLAFSENQLQTLLNCFYSAVPDDINACLSNKQNCQFCDYEELKKFSQKYSNYPDLLIGNVHIADILAKTNANKSMLTFRYGSENKSEPSNVEEIQSPLTQNTKKL